MPSLAGPHPHARVMVGSAATSAGPATLRSPLKWAGGKRWQVPHLRPLWTGHEHRRLVEPFCGGLAVTIGLRPAAALLNDLNPHVVNFYQWLQRGLAISTRVLRNDRVAYDHARTRFNHLVDAGETASTEAAALFYYLNRTGYNGLCRFNARGHFNVPFGRHTTINYESDFDAYRRVFGTWVFRHGDFAGLALEDDDFVYADPPYDGGFTQFASQGFDWQAQRRAATWLARHPGPVVLANRATTRVLRLYASLGFSLTLLEAPRRISCSGDRRPVAEVLATRNLPCLADGALLKTWAGN